LIEQPRGLPRRKWTRSLIAEPLTTRGHLAQSAILGCVGVGVVIGLWQWLAAIKFLDPTAVPTAVSAFRSIGRSLQTAHLWVGIGQTLEAMALGFVIGAAAGISLGTVIGLNQFAYASTFLIVEFLRMIPIIALLPLAVLLFGTTLRMEVILIAFGAIPPTIIQTVYGVRSVEPVVADTARAFHISRFRRFTSVTLPSAAPYLATGLRLGITGALLLAIVAELTGGGSGLGLQMLQAESADVPSYTFAIVIITGCIGMFLVVGLTSLERRILSWHEVYRGSR
jgi:ABC-type nitrate/sulfonate/bicarbonate transport system permease component